MILDQLAVSADPRSGGRIDVSGFTRESGHHNDVDRVLRIGGRDVVSALSNQDLRRTDYPWRFKKTAILEPKSEQEDAESEEAEQGGAGSASDESVSDS